MLESVTLVASLKNFLNQKRPAYFLRYTPLLTLIYLIEFVIHYHTPSHCLSSSHLSITTSIILIISTHRHQAAILCINTFLRDLINQYLTVACTIKRFTAVIY
jgi:hypothetical protein